MQIIGLQSEKLSESLRAMQPVFTHDSAIGVVR